MVHDSKAIHPYELRARSAKVLLQRMYRELSALIAEEVDLAKAEAAARTHSLKDAVRSFAFAAVCGFIGLACVCTAVIVALAAVVTLWASALIVGALLVIAAFALQARGRTALDRATEPLASKLSMLTVPLDARTLAERQERVAWTRRQVNETMAALEQKTDIIAPLRDTALGLGALGVTLGTIVRHNES
jgi:hypothetical protein